MLGKSAPAQLLQHFAVVLQGGGWFGCPICGGQGQLEHWTACGQAHMGCQPLCGYPRGSMSGIPQSKEPLFATALLNDMSYMYVTHAVLSKFQEARTMVYRYANRWRTFDGYAADSTAANTRYHSHQI